MPLVQSGCSRNCWKYFLRPTRVDTILRGGGGTATSMAFISSSVEEKDRHLYIYRPTYLPLPTYISICILIDLFIYLSIYSSIYPFIGLSIHPTFVRGFRRIQKVRENKYTASNINAPQTGRRANGFVKSSRRLSIMPVGVLRSVAIFAQTPPRRKVCL